MKIHLYCPPAISTAIPPLGLPMLKAVLQQNGHSNVTQRDLSLEAISFFLSRKRLSLALSRILKKLPDLPNGDEKVLLGNIASHKDIAQEAVLGCEKALKVLRDEGNTLLTERWVKSLLRRLPYRRIVKRSLKDHKLVQRLEEYWDRRHSERRMEAFRISVAGMRLIAAEYFPVEVEGYFGFSFPYDSRNSSDILHALRSVTRHPYLEFYSEQVLSSVVRERPNLVGISITYWEQVIPGLLLARLVREKIGAHVCVGGALMTEWEQSLLANVELTSLADSFMIGEGEDSIVALARAIDGKGSWGAIPNRIWAEKGEIRRTERKCLAEFKSLPPPDFSGFRLRWYHTVNNLPAPLSYQMSRGCYWKRCAFCFSRKIYCDDYLVADVRKVVDDLEYLISKYRTPRIFFNDESVTPRTLVRLSEEMLSRNLQVSWQIASRFEKGWTSEGARMMADAGCRMVSFGFESGVQRVLDLMEKGTRVEEIERIIEMVVDVGIKVHLFTMIGFPTETEEECQQTLQFIGKKMSTHGSAKVSASLSPFVLHQSAPMFDCQAQYGLKKVFRRDPNLDLSLSFDYEVETGLSQARCEEIMSDRLKNTYVEVPFLTDFWRVALGG